MSHVVIQPKISAKHNYHKMAEAVLFCAFFIVFCKYLTAASNLYVHSTKFLKHIIFMVLADMSLIAKIKLSKSFDS